jgi:hypothetical protein
MLTIRYTWLDTIFRQELARIRIVLGKARGGDGFAALDLAGDFQVQGEELGEQIFVGAEAIGSENGGVQGGVGVFEGVGPGECRR